MKPITYHVKEDSLRSEWSYLLALLLSSAIGLLIWAIFGEFRINPILLIVFGLLLPIYVPWIVRVIRHSSKAKNFLRLDGEGLTHMSRGRTRRWAWPDLSGFEIRGVETFWFPTAGRYVPVVKPGSGAPSRFLRNWRGFEEVIRDIYEAPLDEIAARLNEYRERTLEGG